jgi:hypothetical protein
MYRLIRTIRRTSPSRRADAFSTEASGITWTNLQLIATITGLKAPLRELLLHNKKGRVLLIFGTYL